MGARPSFVPEGWPTLIPRIVVHDARGLVDFLTRVFAVTGAFEETRPSVVRFDDYSVVMISEAGDRDPARSFLYVYVEDADATYRLAVQAGVRTLEEPLDTPYGDRRCTFEDPWGNLWQVATPSR
jgi:uncharacterized glyoxalase superfamily protein PhnB